MPTNKPTKLPRWADNPPLGPPDTITEPSEAEKDNGYQPGKPRRQYTNWLLNLGYQWLAWFKFAALRWRHIGPDFAPAGTGTLPQINPGSLAGTTGAAEVYIGDQHVEAANEAHAYNPSVDTYVDLDVSGAWIFSPVAIGAAAPALAASRFRCWRVRTSAGDVTEAEDLRNANHVPINAPVRLQRPGTNATEQARPVIRTDYSNTSQWTGLVEVAPTPGVALSGIRIYTTPSSVVIAKNAAYSGFVTWTKDRDATAEIIEFGTSLHYASHAQNGSLTFPATEWVEGKIGSTNGVKLGTWLLDTLAEALTSRINIPFPHFTIGKRVCLLDTTPSGGPALRIYLEHESSDAGPPGVSIAINAKLNDDGTWSRDVAGYAAHYLFSRDGMKIRTKDASTTASWNDTDAAGGWILDIRLERRTYSIRRRFAPVWFRPHVGQYATTQAENLSGGQLPTATSVFWHKFGTDSDGVAVMPVRLPHGATIKAAKFHLPMNDLGAGGQTRLAFVRSDFTNQAWETLQASTPGYKTPAHNLANTIVDVDLDPTKAVIDVEGFEYLAWAYATQTVTGLKVGSIELQLEHLTTVEGRVI